MRYYINLCLGISLIAAHTGGCASDMKASTKLEDIDHYSTCKAIRGYLADSSADKIVKVNPNPTSRTLGIIREPIRRGDEVWAPGFDIVGSENGWLKVQDAGDDPVLTGLPSRAMFSGVGWIEGTDISLDIQASQGFLRPDKSSAIIVESNDKIPMHGRGRITKVSQCKDGWVRVSWQLFEPSNVKIRPLTLIDAKSSSIEAWFTGVCNIQETSCDGISGDR